MSYFAALVPPQYGALLQDTRYLRSYMVKQFRKHLGAIIDYRASDEVFILTFNNRIKLELYLFKNIYNNTIILTKISTDIYLNLHKIIAIKFYQFCMMAIIRVSTVSAVDTVSTVSTISTISLLNIDIIKNILSFIDFDFIIQPPAHRCLKISPLFLFTIMRVISEQDQKNKALNELMLNLPSPIFSCSICEDKTCSICCQDITFDADGCYIRYNIMY
uniref:Uncharacterized protein n=1 Tax=viral metagenome TaxID=1070528 RepID=A0A6C0HZV8_9ZZZZ